MPRPAQSGCIIIEIPQLKPVVKLDRPTPTLAD